MTWAMTGWQPQAAALLLALSLAAPVAAIEEAPPPPLLTGVKLELTATLGDGETKVVPNGAVLPYVVGTSCYGWRVKFTPVEDDVQLEEKLILPSAPATWAEDMNSTVAADRRSARTPITANAYGGNAANTWCVAPGDPRGSYRFVVRHGRRVLGTLNFTVGTPPKP
jgi:hypothetical protein